MAVKKDKFANLRLILIQDFGLSLLSSVFSILVIRWLNEPRPGFTLELAKWLGFALLGTLVGVVVTKSHKIARSYVSASAGFRIVNLMILKELVMILALVCRLVYVPSFVFGILLVVLDVLFTTFFLLYVRFLYSRITRETSEVMDLALRKSALVAGVNEKAIALARDLETSKDYHVLGFLSSDPSDSGLIIGEKVVYCCANLEELEKLKWRFGGIDCIFFTEDSGKSSDPGAGGPESGDKMVVSQNDGMSLAGHFVKRSVDIVLSALLLIIFSPLLLICALAVKLEDGGPAIYKQERIGKGGRPFLIYKFRSMVIDAEKGGSPALYSGDSDDRLTRTGRFLRNHHLDELPQLWNVFKGDMSFIGYRPERQFYIDQIMEKNPRYKYLYQIRPGVTSYATLYNSYADSLEKMLTRLDLDLYYLRNHSLSFDARVLWLTFFNIVVGKKF